MVNQQDINMQDLNEPLEDIGRSNQQDNGMGNMMGGIGHWTEFIHPEYLEGPNEPFPNLDAQVQIPVPAPAEYVPPMRPSPARSRTYAEVAYLPYQQGHPNVLPAPPPVFNGMPLQPQNRLVPARGRQLAPAPPPLPPSPPIFRLNMHQETPLHDFELPQAGFQFPPTPGGSIDRSARMATWLRQPINTGERTAMHGQPMATLTPTMLRSPSMSVSGQSDRSTRRSRKHNNAPNRCPHPGCGEGFWNPGDLRKHINGVHGRYEDRRFACALCFKRFRYPKDLDRHQATHEPRKPKFFCPMESCLYHTRGFPRKDNYDRHMENHWRDSGIGMSRSTSHTGGR